MDKKFKQKGIAVFKGLTITGSKVVTLKFALRYDEIITSVELLQATNADITVHAKTPSIDKPVNLGLFRSNGINFDKDGNSVITLKSLLSNVNMDNIYEVMSNEDEVIQLRFMAVLELPDNNENETERGGSEWED